MNLMQILTNENPILINIITILFTIPEVYLFFRLFSLYIPVENTRRNALIYVSIMTFGTVVSLITKNSLLKDSICLIAFIFVVKILFKQSLKSTFFAIVTSYASALISEYLATSVLIHFLKITYEDIMNKPLYYSLVLISTLFIMIVLYFVIKLIKYKNCKINKIPKLPFKISIILNFIFGILTMAIETYFFSVYIDIISTNLLILMIITTLIYFSISMYSLIRTTNLERTSEDLENEKLYNKTLAILHDNIRGFKHDFNNIVQAIGGYVALNDMDGLKKYYEKLLEECKLTNNLNLLNPESINNPSIYSLLTNKYFVANEKNITMNFSIFSDLSGFSTNMYEISRILGILLDNAIEAAEETEEKLIDIEIKSDDKKHIFIIKNSCKDTNISTTKIFEKGYSTKNRDSGFGLWNVHKILEKNINLDLFTSIDDNMFSQKFTIYK